jgi:NTE family protein
LTDHRTWLTRRFILRLALPFISLSVFAQTKYVIPSGDSSGPFRGISIHRSHPAGRPKVGIVLSGGGGRGLAQVGVLRALERNHIPIDFIVGNSLGAVVGGLYASGYSTTQLESIVTHTDWSELLSFSEETKRTDLFVGQKQSEEVGYLLIRFDGLSPIIPSSISGGQRFSNFFSYLTLQALYHPDPDFDDLKIPFRATATDLISGKRVILDHGSLSEAMRASATVPLLYSPLLRDSMVMVDGGLTSNIPVDIARSAGCDIVIAVNSTSSMRNASQLNAPWEIADQIMTIMMQEMNRKELELADVVVTPQTRDRLVSDFSGVDSLIAAGDMAGERSIPVIREALRRPGRHTSAFSAQPFRSARVGSIGDSLPSGIAREIAEEVDDHTLSPRTVEEYVDRLAAIGQYDHVSAEVTEGAGWADVEFRLKNHPPLRSFGFSGNRGVSDELINAELSPLLGRVVDAGLIQQSLERIVALYRLRGYSLARIDSVVIDTGRADLTFRIKEGTIAQIRYEGNERTRDYVIRREFPLDEGDIFRIDRASQGIVNIKSTGLFDYVLLDVRYSGNRPVIVLKVKERSSSIVRLGLHADNEHSLVSTIDIRDANSRGAGEDLSITMRYGSRDRGARLAYTISRIFNTYFTFNTNVYFTSRDVITYRDDPTLRSGNWDRIENGRFKESKYGWRMAFGSQVERFGDVNAELRVENQQISAISGEGYTPERYRFVSAKLKSIVDTEDKFLFPTSGMFFGLSYETALRSLGSEVGFGKVEATYETYLTILPRHTLRPRVTFGFADATLPIAEQYTLGGFRSLLGLREDDSYGRQLFLVNMEYRFSLPFRVIFDTYVKARYDLGTISLIPEELKINSFRHGLGGEVALDTPLGEAAFGAGLSFYLKPGTPNSSMSFGPVLLYFSVGPRL